MLSFDPIIEQRDELVLDALRRRAGDLLPADPRRQRAEGVDLLGEARGAEDCAGISVDDGLQAGLHGDEVRDCIVKESSCCAGGVGQAAFAGRRVGETVEGVGCHLGATWSYERGVRQMRLNGPVHWRGGGVVDVAGAIRDAECGDKGGRWC